MTVPTRLWTSWELEWHLFISHISSSILCSASLTAHTGWMNGWMNDLKEDKMMLRTFHWRQAVNKCFKKEGGELENSLLELALPMLSSILR